MYGLCKQSVKAKWQQVVVLHRRVDLSECEDAFILWETCGPAQETAS